MNDLTPIEMDEFTRLEDAETERPRGFRLGRAGWALRVATDTYVHHSKSKSFGHANRKELTRAANQILRSRHPEVNFASIEERMRSDPTIIRVRRELARLLHVEQAASRHEATEA